MKIKELVVVEGKEDTRRLKEVFQNIDTIETRGSAISLRTIELIRQSQISRGVIIFTDPDYQGQRIRNIINNAVPNCKNAYISKDKAVCVKKKKVGVEHCSDTDIIEALSSLTIKECNESDVTIADLLKLKLIGSPDSDSLREFISDKLHLGYNNGKQFLNKIKSFNISKETLLTLIDEYEVKNGQ